MDHKSHVFSEVLESFGGLDEIALDAADVDDHHHVEEILEYGLIDVKDIDVLLRKICTYLCDDAYSVFSYYCDDCTFHVFTSYLT